MVTLQTQVAPVARCLYPQLIQHVCGCRRGSLVGRAGGSKTLRRPHARGSERLAVPPSGSAVSCAAGAGAAGARAQLGGGRGRVGHAGRVCRRGALWLLPPAAGLRALAGAPPRRARLRLASMLSCWSACARTLCGSRPAAPHGADICLQLECVWAPVLPVASALAARRPPSDAAPRGRRTSLCLPACPNYPIPSLYLQPAAPCAGGLRDEVPAHALRGARRAGGDGLRAAAARRDGCGRGGRKRSGRGGGGGGRRGARRRTAARRAGPARVHVHVLLGARAGGPVQGLLDDGGPALRGLRQRVAARARGGLPARARAGVAGPAELACASTSFSLFSM